MRDTLDMGRPDQRVYDVLGVTDPKIIMPVRHAQSLAGWIGRCHAYYGLGYPTTLIELHTKLLNDLHALSTHPAMWGHGMLGTSQLLPISCWAIPDASYPDQQFCLEPVGVEGFLVPTKQRIDTSIFTAWTFTAERHGLPRPTQTMFKPSFATRGAIDIDPATQDAAAAKVRAVILGQAETPLEEDGADLPSSP